SGEPQWMAIRYGYTRTLHGLQGLIEEQRGQARSAKLATLSRLQRSLISDRVAAVSKDSTVKLATFLSAVVGTALEYLASDFWSFEAFREHAHFLRLICIYFERTLRLSTATDFDEAAFQAHLALGVGFLQSQSEKFAAK